MLLVVTRRPHMEHAQGNAPGLAACLSASAGNEEAWRTCIRQTDPDAVSP